MERTKIRSRAALVGLALVAASMLLAGQALALTYNGVGGRLGVTSPDDLNSTTELGVHAQLDQPGTRMAFQPSLMYWKSEDTRDVNPNLDLTYRFEPRRTVHPYLGGGLGLNFVDDSFSSSTEAGMNLLGGVSFPSTGHDYFIEARHTVSDVSRTAVMAGITFNAP